MRLKSYSIYRAGSEQIGTITATCITKAAARFISTLERPASCEVKNKEYATIRYADNYCVMSDFVITKA